LKNSVKDLTDQFAEANEIRTALSERLKNSPDDVALSLCLQSTDDHIKDLLHGLKVAEREEPPVGVDDRRELPVVENLLSVESNIQLMGYYLTRGLEKLDDKINSLKGEMDILAVLGETEVTPEERLSVLEDTILLGYWKAFYHGTDK